MALFFVMLLLVVQSAFLVTARNAAEAAAAAAARVAALPDADLGEVLEALEANVASTVPGATEVTAEGTRDRGAAVISVRLRWSPPGPDLVPVTIRVAAERTLEVAP